MRSVSVKLSLVGLLAFGWAQSYRCDTLRVAAVSRWYYHGDTIRVEGGLPTIYLRWVHGGRRDSTDYTWWWWVRRLPSGAHVNSGSATGYDPSLSGAIPGSAITGYPSFFELWIVGHQYRYGPPSYACMDSARFVVRVDSPPRFNLPSHCHPDSFFLRIAGRSVRRGHILSLPLGSYSFEQHPQGDVFSWELRGPSGYQSGGSTNQNPIGTLHLTVPGRHVLRIIHYLCLIDTLIYYLDATYSPWGSCSTFVGRGCAPSLVVNGASYLPGHVITLPNGAYNFHLQPPAPLPPSASYYISWFWNCHTAPGGYVSGSGGSWSGGAPSFSAIVRGSAVCTLQVITSVNWFCPITQVCRDTSVFYVRGNGRPNDTVTVTCPGDTNVYTPGDTIPLPVDTVCLHTGVLTPYPDSLYWWWWHYYGPNGGLIDSGITPVVCVYPAGGPGVYSLVYSPQPPRPAQRVSGQRQTFYLNFGARTTGIASKPEGGQPVLYPVPTAGPVWLSLPERGIYEVQVRDVLGRLLTHQTLEGDRVHYLPLQLSSGLYLVEVRKGTQITLLRLLVE